MNLKLSQNKGNAYSYAQNKGKIVQYYVQNKGESLKL